jgi:hypothetical protein
MNNYAWCMMKVIVEDKVLLIICISVSLTDKVNYYD